MHRPTAGTAQAPEINRFWQAGKVGQDKSVPPHLAVTMGTGPGLGPGKFPAKTRDFLDGNGNKKYQWNNSSQELLTPAGWE